MLGAVKTSADMFDRVSEGWSDWPKSAHALAKYVAKLFGVHQIDPNALLYPARTRSGTRWVTKDELYGLDAMKQRMLGAYFLDD